MKKVIVSLLIAILITLAMNAVCFAAGETRSINLKSNGSSNTKVGDTVTVTVIYGSNVYGAQYNLNYPSSLVKYTGQTGSTVGNKGDYLKVADMGLSPITSKTFTFKVEKEGNISFSLSNVKLGSLDGNYEAQITGGSSFKVSNVTPTEVPTKVPTAAPTQAPTKNVTQALTQAPTKNNTTQTPTKASTTATGTPTPTQIPTISEVENVINDNNTISNENVITNNNQNTINTNTITENNSTYNNMTLIIAIIFAVVVCIAVAFFIIKNKE